MTSPLDGYKLYYEAGNETKPEKLCISNSLMRRLTKWLHKDSTASK